MVDAHFRVCLMICLTAFLILDVCVALKMLSLLMAEQQQHLAVGVTLYLLENEYDTPFWVLALLMGCRKKIVIANTFIELVMNNNAIKQNGCCCCCLYR